MLRVKGWEYEQPLLPLPACKAHESREPSVSRSVCIYIYMKCQALIALGSSVFLHIPILFILPVTWHLVNECARVRNPKETPGCFPRNFIHFAVFRFEEYIRSLPSLQRGS